MAVSLSREPQRALTRRKNLAAAVPAIKDFWHTPCAQCFQQLRRVCVSYGSIDIVASTYDMSVCQHTHSMYEFGAVIVSKGQVC